jgi:3-mercaptopyruvate sulfurtransferase SseA
MSTHRHHNRLDKIEQDAGASTGRISLAYFDPTADEPPPGSSAPFFVEKDRLDAWMDEAGTEDTTIVVRYGSEAADL